MKAVIYKEPTKAPLGSLVIAKGSMALRDYSQFITMWPIFKKALNWKQITQDASAQLGGIKLTVSDIEGIIKSSFENLPQPIHLKLVGEKARFWTTLHEKNFVVSPVDLFLKHQSTVPGEWMVLGVLDADLAPEKDLSFSDDTEGLHVMLSHFRQMFGRPKGFYGISPLVIFRKVRKTSSV